MYVADVALPAIALAAAWAVTGIVRRYALSTRLLDVPNHRSSHAAPTPRGGGVAIAIITLAALPILFGAGDLGAMPTLGIAGGGMLVAVTGFLDDRRGLPARVRLASHFVAAAWVVGCFWFAPPPSTVVAAVGAGAGGDALSAWIVAGGAVLGAVYIVWLLNLTNFMDGIDGIAGAEIVCVCVGGAIVGLSAGLDLGTCLVLLIVAGATLGFLLWNWPPAKIFMGDTGSGFLGYVVGALSLYFAASSERLFWAWLVLMGVFVVDATLTLLHRVRRGERLTEAHRCHAYQHAARRCGNHRPVTLAVLAINIGWLLPIALGVAFDRIRGPVALALAYLPLVALAEWLGAGRRDASDAPAELLGGLDQHEETPALTEAL